MQYATCTANRPTSIGSSSNGLTAHSSTNSSPKPNEASKQTNERTEQRTAPEEDFYDYGSIHLPFCLVAVVISVAGAAATRPPLPSRRQLDEQDCCCWWLLIHEEASGASFLSSESHSLSLSF